MENVEDYKQKYNKQHNKEDAQPSSHEFSSLWEDSDLVLVVENQNLHVHSFILKMASPVFKAMLSGEFKEKNQQEISLPGKKVDHFVDFLRQIYPQFDYPITLENVEQTYLLADEYQVTSIMTSCHQVLTSFEITRDNLTALLSLAQKMGCDEVRQKCYEIFSTMPVCQLKQFQDSIELDNETLVKILFAKAEGLEQCLQKIQPQFVGVMNCLLYVWRHIDTKICDIKDKPRPCERHTSYESKAAGSINERLKCSGCVQTWRSMVYCSSDPEKRSHSPHYSNMGMYFDDNLVSVLQEMFDILKTN